MPNIPEPFPVGSEKSLDDFLDRLEQAMDWEDEKPISHPYQPDDEVN